MKAEEASAKVDANRRERIEEHKKSILARAERLIDDAVNAHSKDVKVVDIHNLEVYKHLESELESRHYSVTREDYKSLNMLVSWGTPYRKCRRLLLRIRYVVLRVIFWTLVAIGLSALAVFVVRRAINDAKIREYRESDEAKHEARTEGF